MKFTKNYLLLLLSLFVLASCSEDKLNDQTSKKLEYNDNLVKTSESPNTTPFPEVQQDERLRESMVSFVDAIEPFYETGMTYSNLKSALDPDNSLSNMKSEGDALLHQAYTYLKNDTRDINMNGDKLLDAFAATLQNPSVAEKDFMDVTEEDYESISRHLFGLSSEYDVETYGGCKWYQVGCHANWLIGEIGEWWNTPAPGDGDKTNGEVVVGISTALGIIFGFVI